MCSYCCQIKDSGVKACRETYSLHMFAHDCCLNRATWSVSVSAKRARDRLRVRRALGRKTSSSYAFANGDKSVQYTDSEPQECMSPGTRLGSDLPFLARVYVLEGTVALSMWGRCCSMKDEAIRSITS